MDKNEAIAKFCELATRVRIEEFKNEHPADCFCPSAGGGLYFQFSPAVMNFITEAVSEKLARK